MNATFTVGQHSNDDYGKDGFVDNIMKRISQAPSKDKDVFCAFCATREKRNNSFEILTNKPFSSFDEIHVILLKYKWDFHAELRINEIKNHLSSVPNIKFFVIDADNKETSDEERSKARDQQIISYLKSIYP